jgi:methionine aminopeptidase
LNLRARFTIVAEDGISTAHDEHTVVITRRRASVLTAV